MRRGEAGFTLVEALVSLFVFSLVAAGSTAMLMQSVDSQKRVGEAHAALRELQTARALMAADLAQIVPRGARDSDGVFRPRFVGGDADTALAFTRATAEPDAEAGAHTALSFVEYVIDEDGRVLRRARADLEASQYTEINERVLLAEAEDARFEFFDGQQWGEQWLAAAEGQSWPRAVALEATLPRYGRVRVEVLVGLAP